MFIRIFQFKESNRLSNDKLTLSTHDIHLFSLDNFKLCRNVVKIAENINSRFGEGRVSVEIIQRWFVKYKTSDFQSENKPGRKIKRSWNIRF